MGCFVQEGITIAPPDVDALVKKAQEAQKGFMKLDQRQVDAIVKAMALAGVDKHLELARLAFDETKMGVYEDKVTKNLFASEYVYHDIKGERTVGVIEENPEEDYFKIAEPIGVLAALTPVTNPTSTVLFKSLIAVKTRNPIIFSFHPKAANSSQRAAEIMLEAAVAAGAPEDCIGWLEAPTKETTQALMRHPGVALILATGGAAMVHEAYSAGKPALGVGPGNVPCFIERTANLRRAVADIIISKTFDNGMICASEQALIVDAPVAAEVRRLMEDFGCRFLSRDEASRLQDVVMKPGTCSVNPEIVGQSAGKIAAVAGVDAPPETKILVVELEGVGFEHPLSAEKLCPVLAFYVVDGLEAGIRRCEEMTEFGGMGHSAVIHSEDPAAVEAFARRVRTGRLIVNSPSSQGAIGDLYNTNTPSLTLGCGSMGHNSTTDNVSVQNLINVKRVAMRRERMKWFKVPPKIYFEPGSLAYLAKVHAKRAFIVTDKIMVKLGMVDRVTYYLDKAGIEHTIFSDVEPDPSVQTVMSGTAKMREFEPDLIVAFGGGSPIDAAKGMWLFYESPETEFETLRLKFADIRKRAFKYPRLGKRALLVAVPTTSGTGSEVTAFAVITDKERDIKYPLADYELTPDIAIIDPDLVMSVPKEVTANTGMDVLTHAIEAYVSIMASDYTDALARQAIELTLTHLPTAYADGSDKAAREKMHNASCLAGMAFTNAFLGLNHGMAHILGASFHIPHGRANAVLLPYVMRYNAQPPSKFVAFPQYDYPHAAERYAEIARFLGLPAASSAEGVESLVKAVVGLMRKLEMPLSLREYGISQDDFERQVQRMAEVAFDDQTTGTNPRFPLIEEIIRLYREAYDGEGLPGELFESGVTASDPASIHELVTV